jgi:hypothetical protein
MRLMSVPQRLGYLTANCALAAISYSWGEAINTAFWGEYVAETSVSHADSWLLFSKSLLPLWLIILPTQLNPVNIKPFGLIPLKPKLV